MRHRPRLIRTQQIGYVPSVPTVLRVAGFRVVIHFPPREHAPANVHVFDGEGEVVIDLPSDTTPQRTRTVIGMNRANVRRAERIVAKHTGLLMQEWRRIWGPS